MADKKEVPASATVPKPVAAVNDDQLYGLPRGEYMVHVHRHLIRVLLI